MTVRAHHQPTAGVHPTEPTLSVPALSGACTGTKWTPTLRLLAVTPRSRWHGGCATTTTQGMANIDAVIGVVCHHLVWSRCEPTAIAWNANGLHRRFSQRAFVWLCVVHVQADGYASAIDHCHHRRVVTDRCRASTIAPLCSQNEVAAQ